MAKKDARPSGHGTFSDGYIAGWKAVLGKDAMPTHIPGPQKIPNGLSAYEHGYEQGRAVAGGK
jgi:hypothetical protein